MNTLFAYFESHYAMALTFSRDIVEQEIGDLLFNLDDESVHLTRARALSVFKMHEDVLPEDKAELYFVKIESVLRLKIVLEFVSKKASFRSASRFVDVAGKVTKLSYRLGCSESVRASYL